MTDPMRHDLTVVMVPLSEVIPWSRNPRRNDDAADRLLPTIGKLGWTTPILLQKGTGRVLAGHTRLKAAAKMELTEIPAIYLDVTETEAKEITISDNRLGELAEWDGGELGALLKELAEDDGADLLAVGYNDEELDELLAALSEPTSDEWGDAFGRLPSGDRLPIRQMTFTVHDDQHGAISRALAAAKAEGDFGETGNENSNGNALDRLCRRFLGEA